MKALVYHGPDAKAWEDVPDAAVQEPTDVVVRVDTTTICGTDLHILQGDVPASRRATGYWCRRSPSAAAASTASAGCRRTAGRSAGSAGSSGT
jgi:hypothetical protein